MYDVFLVDRTVPCNEIRQYQTVCFALGFAGLKLVLLGAFSMSIQYF